MEYRKGGNEIGAGRNFKVGRPLWSTERGEMKFCQ